MERLDRGTTELTCNCTSKAANAGGTIWGSDIYTEHSPIYDAARHAG